MTQQKNQAPAAETLITESELMRLVTLLRGASKFVVCGHRSPDGDALGSALAWAAYLRGVGKSVSIVMPNAFPDFLRWMPGSQTVTFYQGHEAAVRRLVSEADVVCLLDLNDPTRLGDMGECIQQSRAELLIIDHHLASSPVRAAVGIVRPCMSATAELVFRLIERLGGLPDMTRASAACLYTGMMTDTGAFTYNSSRPEVYEVVGQLLRKGIDKDRIYRNVYHCFSENRLRLTGYVMYEKLRFLAGRRAALFTLTREEMKRFHYLRGDAEGLVNMPLQVRGTVLSISLREDTERDVVRVSLRSVDQFPANKMAEEFFGGGGHLNAAGGQLPFPLDEAVKTAERAVEAFAEYFPPQK